MAITGYYQLPIAPQGERTIVVKKERFRTFKSMIDIFERVYEFDIRLIEDTDDCIDPDGRSYKTVKIRFHFPKDATDITLIPSERV